MDGNTVVTRAVTSDGAGRTTGTREDRVTHDSSGDVVAESTATRNADNEVTELQRQPHEPRRHADHVDHPER